MRKLVRAGWFILNWTIFVLTPLWVIPLGVAYIAYGMYRQYKIPPDDFTDDDWFIRDLLLKGDRFIFQEEECGYRSKDYNRNLRFNRTMTKLLEAKRRPNRIKKI